MRVSTDFSRFIRGKAPSALTTIPRHLNHPLVTHRPFIINGHSITSNLHFSNLADPTRLVRGWHDLLKNVQALEGVKPTIVLPPLGPDGKGWMRPPSSTPLAEPTPKNSESTPLESRLLWVNSLHRQTSSSSIPPFSSLPRPTPPPSAQTTPSILRGWSEDQAFWLALRSSLSDSSPSSQEAEALVTSHRRKIAKQIWLDQRKDSRPTEEDKEEVVELMRLMGVRVVRSRAREEGESLERVCRRLIVEEEKKSGQEGLVLSASYVPLLYGSSTLHYTPQSPILPLTPTPFTHASLPTLLSTLFPSEALPPNPPHPNPLTSLVNLALLTGNPDLSVPKIPQLAFVRAWGAITEYGSPEGIDPKAWRFGKSVKEVMRWEEWLEVIRKSGEEFVVGEKKGEGWVEEEEGGEGGRNEVALSAFLKEKVEGREGLMGEKFWDEVAEEFGSKIEE